MVGASCQLLDELLLRQVVDSHMRVGGHKEEGAEGMEEEAGDLAVVLLEGVLGGGGGEVVDQNGAGEAWGGGGGS